MPPFLADGVGTEHYGYHHAQQVCRERDGKERGGREGRGMVWEQNTSSVIMLNKLWRKERGRGVWYGSRRIVMSLCSISAKERWWGGEGDRKGT